MVRLLPFPSLLMACAIACSSGKTGPSGPDPQAEDQARVRIDNRASLDMDIYLLRGGGQALRLGFVPGGEKSTFALPPTLTAGAVSITFEARPVRRSGQAVRSEPFRVSPGEEITWSIPPQ
jgi:hypothetical protein